MSETVLIVDDEDGVRRTFQEWLTAGIPGARVFVAPDASTALRVANEEPVDLAVLDWNLGSGSDGGTQRGIATHYVPGRVLAARQYQLCPRVYRKGKRVLCG